jgi:hypothetical protein
MLQKKISLSQPKNKLKYHFVSCLISFVHTWKSFKTVLIKWEEASLAKATGCWSD